MPRSVKTFIDSGVLIAAIGGTHAVSTEAQEIIDDEGREFYVSDVVRLEVLPKAVFHRRQAEIEFYEAFFAKAHVALTYPDDVERARTLIARYNLAPFDAMLAQAALELDVDEFVTTEKPTKPLFSIQGVRTRFVSL